jgi:O-antigen ligase
LAKKNTISRNTGTKAPQPPRKNDRTSVTAVRAFPWLPVLLGVIFFAVTLSGSWAMKYESELLFVLVSGFLFLFTFFFRKNRNHLISGPDPILFILLAHTLLYFIGLFYASFPKLALSEFFKNAGGFFIFAICRVSFMRDERNIHRLFAVLAVSIGALCLICIELATSGLLLPLIRKLSGLVGTPVHDGYASFENNTRITTVITNPNIFAAIAGIGIFLSLSVRMHYFTVPARRIVFTGVGIVCGTAFVLCFSMGAILAFIASFALLLLLSGKKARKAFVLPTVYVFAVSFLGAAAVFACLNQGILPVLLVILLSAGASALQLPGLLRLPSLLPGKKKGIVAAICAAAVVLLAAAAIIIKAPYALSQGGEFRRAVYLKPGEYTLNIDLSDPEAPVTAEIRSMSYTQAALKESTVLSNSVLRSGERVSFTVPDSSAAVFFRFRADAAPLRLETASVQSGNGAIKQLPLKYVLLPEFIVNRLQGIWVNDNAAQRFVFFRDGIRLGMRSPVFGLGGGAFEGAARSVAEYYYATAHTHSQYIQSFIDGGIIGLILFFAPVLYLLAGLFKARKSERPPVFIGAALAMIFLHSAIEVDFMHPAFRMLASAVFAAASVAFPYRFRLLKPAGKPAAYSALILSVVTLALACGRIWAVRAFKSPDLSLKSLRTAAVLDPFNDVDYKISYLLNSINLGGSISVQSQAEQYLASLENDRMIPGTAQYLAMYYLQKQEPDFEKAAEMAERCIRGERVNPLIWDAILSLYRSAMETAGDEGDAALAGSLTRLTSYLAQLNSTLPKQITPAFILPEYVWAQIQSAPDKTIDITAMKDDPFGSGSSGLMSKTDGSTAYTVPVIARPGESFTVCVYQDESLKCDILVDGVSQPLTYDSSKGCYVLNINLPAFDFELSVSVPDLADVRITIARTYQNG